MSEVVDLILQLSAVPSFSYHEERLHPLVTELVSAIPGARIERVPKNNLVVSVPGDASRRPVALTAHLDKIDHYGTGEQPLEAFVRGDKIVGPMDDCAGLGIVLAVARAAPARPFPPLLLLLSEQEECGGIGAVNISAFLVREGRVPSVAITLDTTPLFRGAAGVAIYAAPWERSGHAASPELMAATAALRDRLCGLCPELRVANNGNDYVTYGTGLNPPGSTPVPSVALEPSIFPYHRKHEEVFVADVLRLEELLLAYCATPEPRAAPARRSWWRWFRR